MIARKTTTGLIQRHYSKLTGSWRLMVDPNLVKSKNDDLFGLHTQTKTDNSRRFRVNGLSTHKVLSPFCSNKVKDEEVQFVEDPRLKHILLPVSVIVDLVVPKYEVI